jgi:hypothetical protein
MRAFRRVALTFGSILLISSAALGQARLGPHVVDSSGQRIGYFAGLNPSTGLGMAVVFINGQGYLIDTARAGFISSEVNDFFNAASDCTGQNYRSVNPTGDLLDRAWFTTDGFFYYASSASASEVPIYGSRVLHSDGTFGPCSEIGGTMSFVSPLLKAQAPTLTPPFLVVDAFPVSPAPGSATFNDVSTTDQAFRFIEALSKAGITSGCQTSPPLYCPDNQITRREMAVFLAVALGL